MPYAIEISAKNRSLSEEMGQMRTWLDHKGYRPITFRSMRSNGADVFRVEFTVAAEAQDFARAFGGRPLDTPADEGLLVGLVAAAR